MKERRRKKAGFDAAARAAALFFAAVILFFPSFASAGFPLTANYYLNRLESSSDFVSRISRYNVLIFTPSQIAWHQSVIEGIRKINPDIIILAYLPIQSYNIRYWPSDIIFRQLHVDEDWWLKDQYGNYTRHSQDLLNINLRNEWSRYYAKFINEKVLSLNGIDGVFFDMVTENISWLNSGNIDLNGDGIKDSAAFADSLWLERTKYFLQYAKDNLKTKYIVINGSSNPSFQTYVNGRMFETFPTPWESNGSWAAVMDNWVRNKKSNQKPLVTIINSNTSNTGDSADYKKVRFGLASALMEDGYYSFDYGDQNHGQLWWYDEYDVNLGKPTASAVSKSNFQNYQPDVWQRDFANGIALVNSTEQEQLVKLNGEYEKIHGAQDKKINDGSIVSETILGGYDGLVMLKTFETLQDVLFKNGSFVRFFRPDGSRARNGFFVFEEKYKGGDKIAHIDLDGNGLRDLLAVLKNKIMAWRADGQILMKDFPYTVNYRGELKVAVGDLDNDEKMEIYVAPSTGYPAPIKTYILYGDKVVGDWLPFGSKYKGGYSLAVKKSAGASELVIGAGKGAKPEVLVYDGKFSLLKRWLAFESTFTGGVNVSAGDVNGDGIDEIIVGAGPGKKPIIRIFDRNGKQLYPDFTAYEALDKPGIEVSALDVDYDGKDEIIGFSE